MDEVKVWWQSRTILSQIVGMLFAIASVVMGRDLGEMLGMSQEEFLAGVMFIVTLAGIIFRIRTTELVAATPARAEDLRDRMERAHAHHFAPPRAASPFPGVPDEEVEEIDPPVTEGQPFSAAALKQELDAEPVKSKASKPRKPKPSPSRRSR